MHPVVRSPPKTNPLEMLLLCSPIGIGGPYSYAPDNNYAAGVYQASITNSKTLEITISKSSKQPSVKCKWICRKKKKRLRGVSHLQGKSGVQRGHRTSKILSRRSFHTASATDVPSTGEPNDPGIEPNPTCSRLRLRHFGEGKCCEVDSRFWRHVHQKRCI